MSGACVGIGVDESTDSGVVISGLAVIKVRFSIAHIALRAKCADFATPAAGEFPSAAGGIFRS